MSVPKNLDPWDSAQPFEDADLATQFKVFITQINIRPLSAISSIGWLVGWLFIHTLHSFVAQGILQLKIAQFKNTK